MAKISVIIPCRNERTHIQALLDSVLAQEHAPHELEVLVADGMSDDGTRAVLADYVRDHPEIRLLDNPGRTTPAALDLLLSHVTGDFIIRLDAHATCPAAYVSTLVKSLARGDADNVGGVVQTVSANRGARATAIAICMNSPFGVGASFRTLGGFDPVEVDSVPFGAWRRDHFRKYGPFDQRFTRAQDLEHNVRVKRMGGRILCLPWLVIPYFGRETYGQLRRMAFQYGYWKIPVKFKHQVRFSSRQYLPPLMLLMLLASIPLALWVPWLSVIPVGYVVLTAMFAMVEAVNSGHVLYAPLCLLGFIILHLFYGAGYLRGIWDTFVARKWAFTDISR